MTKGHKGSMGVEGVSPSKEKHLALIGENKIKITYMRNKK